MIIVGRDRELPTNRITINIDIFLCLNDIRTDFDLRSLSGLEENLITYYSI